jgi:hypothetical protein
MALPKITHPVFKINIPSTNKPVGFRPYTVKEEKLLMFMSTAEDIEEVIETIKQVINNCCVDSINVDKLSMFDLEYIFIKLRSKSVGEILELNYTINDEKYKFEVNLEDIEVKRDPNHKTRIILHNNIGAVMKYPSFATILKLEKQYDEDSKNIDSAIFNIFTSCVENIFDDDKVYKEFTKEELDEFILSLPKKSFDVIKEFFDTMPVVEHRKTLKLKDGSNHEVVMRGLKDFFIF